MPHGKHNEDDGTAVSKRRDMLHIFDADGTLCDRATGEFLPGVREGLQDVWGDIAIATNQGGPACRDAGWGDHFPTLAEVEERYGRLAASIPGCRLYMSLTYLARDGRMIVPAGLPPDDPRLNPEWRKPRPGMILQAMADFGAVAKDTVFVGDSEEDKQAAKAAGVMFFHASQFFK